MTRENPFERESRRLNRLFAQGLLSRVETTAAALRTTPAGRVVMRSGTWPKSLPLVEAGKLQAVIHTGAEGQRVVPVTFEEGEIAMCSLLFSSSPVHADIVTAESCQLRWLPMTSIESAVEAHPQLGLPLIRFLAQRLREVQMRERVWLSRGLPARVWAALMREVAGAEPGPDSRWVVRLTHEALAERAGVSRPRLSLTLKAMEREGRVLISRGRIEIPVR
jgi:CRP/FNR family transcriptional regulator, anaerobic regulatory protein